MKFTYLLLSMLYIFGPPARAALGGNVHELTAEGAALKMTAVVVSSAHGYNVHEFRAKKITIHQFAAMDGKIFAVAWQGKTHPDLALLMGTHFADFEKALAQAKKSNRGHTPIKIEVEGFHLELGGHAMAVYGRAWLVDQLPDKVNTYDLH